ncbi:hypothetical protein SELMODRAFT_414071 [Selaginella moellendorffii]|uniref:Uncharacterized protein n=1 Tax=Selaginella moellendorffii TaxID=88036 RepID=D8RRJ6_SELML|nr:hypothetical protein SELMODRAFT_414071 [Selaginella moellendorffii]
MPIMLPFRIGQSDYSHCAQLKEQLEKAESIGRRCVIVSGAYGCGFSVGSQDLEHLITLVKAESFLFCAPYLELSRHRRKALKSSPYHRPGAYDVATACRMKIYLYCKSDAQRGLQVLIDVKGWLRASCTLPGRSLQSECKSKACSPTLRHRVHIGLRAYVRYRLYELWHMEERPRHGREPAGGRCLCRCGELRQPMKIFTFYDGVSMLGETEGIADGVNLIEELETVVVQYFCAGEGCVFRGNKAALSEAGLDGQLRGLVFTWMST